MQPPTTLRRSSPPPSLRAVGHRTISSSLSLVVAADEDRTQRALDDLDAFGPAIRAMRALGLADHVTITPAGIRWRPDRDSGHIDVQVDMRIGSGGEGDSSLTIITRFSATDERTHARLLDAWPVLGRLTATLVKRAADAVKHHAEEDRFEAPQMIDDEARAA